MEIMDKLREEIKKHKPVYIDSRSQKFGEIHLLEVLSEIDKALDTAERELNTLIENKDVTTEIYKLTIDMLDQQITYLNTLIQQKDEELTEQENLIAALNKSNNVLVLILSEQAAELAMYKQEQKLIRRETKEYIGLNEIQLCPHCGKMICPEIITKFFKCEHCHHCGGKVKY